MQRRGAGPALPPVRAARAQGFLETGGVEAGTIAPMPPDVPAGGQRTRSTEGMDIHFPKAVMRADRRGSTVGREPTWENNA